MNWYILSEREVSSVVVPSNFAQLFLMPVEILSRKDRYASGQVFGNKMRECIAYGVKIEAHPQGQICDNDILPPTGVDEDEVRSLTLPAVKRRRLMQSAKSHQSEFEPRVYQEFEEIILKSPVYM